MSIYAPSFYMPSQANFIYKRREISAVSNEEFAEVTTTEDHGYFIGQLIRMHVPENYGMVLDGVECRILSIPTDDTFTIDIDTSVLFPFVTPSTPPAFTEAHCVPITGTENNIASQNNLG